MRQSRVCQLLGSGKQSLTRLAAQLCNMDVMSIELTKVYGVQEWREDLTRILKTAGGKMEPVVFMLTDSQIKDESYIEVSVPFLEKSCSSDRCIVVSLVVH